MAAIIKRTELPTCSVYPTGATAVEVAASREEHKRWRSRFSGMPTTIIFGIALLVWLYAARVLRLVYLKARNAAREASAGRYP